MSEYTYDISPFSSYCKVERGARLTRPSTFWGSQEVPYNNRLRGESKPLHATEAEVCTWLSHLQSTSGPKALQSPGMQRLPLLLRECSGLSLPPQPPGASCHPWPPPPGDPAASDQDLREIWTWRTLTVSQAGTLQAVSCVPLLHITHSWTCVRAGKEAYVLEGGFCPTRAKKTLQFYVYS